MKNNLNNGFTLWSGKIATLSTLSFVAEADPEGGEGWPWPLAKFGHHTQHDIFGQSVFFRQNYLSTTLAYNTTHSTGCSALVVPPF